MQIPRSTRLRLGLRILESSHELHVAHQSAQEVDLLLDGSLLSQHRLGGRRRNWLSARGRRTLVCGEEGQPQCRQVQGRRRGGAGEGQGRCRGGAGQGRPPPAALAAVAAATPPRRSRPHSPRPPHPGSLLRAQPQPSAHRTRLGPCGSGWPGCRRPPVAARHAGACQRGRAPCASVRPRSTRPARGGPCSRCLPWSSSVAGWCLHVAHVARRAGSKLCSCARGRVIPGLPAGPADSQR